LADANRVAPNRSKASDGIIGDATHSASVSDHNPDPRGVVHAVDVTNDPAAGMSGWFWANIVAQRIIAGKERRVKYLVSNDGTHDKIFNPAVSYTWRNNNAEGGQSHRSHLHVSILYTPAAEGDITNFFVLGGPAPGAPAPVPIPVQESPDVSNTVYYAIDKADHQFFVNKFNSHLIHRYGNGATEDLTLKTNTAGKLWDATQPVVAKIRPDTFGTVIDVYGVKPDQTPVRATYKPYAWSVA
jgi:hypothetical protein